LRRKAGVKIFDLRANAILRKRVLDLTGHVAVNITKPVKQKNQDGQRHDADRGRSGGDDEVAPVKKTAATALWRYRMAALSIELGDRFGDWRERFIGGGAQGVANLL